MKVVILSLVFMFLLPDVCQAQREMEKETGEKLYSGMNGNNSSLDYVISVLLDNVADLTPEVLQNTHDKKSYLRLFIHPKYNKVCPPLQHSTSAEYRIPPPDGLETTAYYIYALRKIVI